MVDVPEHLRAYVHYPYPMHQHGPDMEARATEWVFKNARDTNYVPILWTTQYLLNGMKPTDDAQEVLDSLDPAKRFYTVVMNDDGILERVPENLTVYGCSKGIPIPLLCDPHPVQRRERDLWCSFVGCLSGVANNRTMVRVNMAKALLNKPGFHLFNSRSDVNGFREAMARSVFALCPRGYGPTSFRMYEAMQLGAIPVYVYDEPMIPYASELDWSRFAVLCHIDQIDQLPDMLAACDVPGMQGRLAEVYPQYFTHAAMMRWIIANERKHEHQS